MARKTKAQIRDPAAGEAGPPEVSRRFEWPGGGQPWLVLIGGTSAGDAHRAVDTSDAVRRGQGRIASVDEVA